MHGELTPYLGLAPLKPGSRAIPVREHASRRGNAPVKKGESVLDDDDALNPIDLWLPLSCWYGIFLTSASYKRGLLSAILHKSRGRSQVLNSALHAHSISSFCLASVNLQCCPRALHAACTRSTAALRHSAIPKKDRRPPQPARCSPTAAPEGLQRLLPLYASHEQMR